MKKSEIVKKLKEVRALLTPKKNWTQGFTARDKNGRRTTVNSDNAVCWCLGGALIKICKDSKVLSVMENKIDNSLPKGFNNYVKYNDNRSHRSVLKLIDKAIAAK